MTRSVQGSGMVLRLHMPLIAKTFADAGQQKIAPGMLFQTGGNKVTDIYFLQKGVVRLNCSSGKKNIQLLYLGEYNLINDISLFSGTGESALDIWSVTPVELKYLPYQQFFTRLQDMELFLEVIRCLGEKACCLLQHLHALRFFDAEKRVGSFLKDLNELSSFIPGKKTFSLSQAEIADALALHRVTVCRAMGKFAK